jgi:hypothetical protein
VPIAGRERVAKFLLGVLALAPPDLELVPAWINGTTRVVTRVAGARSR